MFISLSGCNLNNIASPIALHSKAKPSPPAKPVAIVKSLDDHDNIWERMAVNFQLGEYHSHAKVQSYVKKYLKEGYHLHKVSKHAEPYIYHITTTLEENGLPTEFAVLPMIESAYKPHAHSHKGAAGVWQFNRVTGKYYGLQLDPWFDARFDIQESTKAAIKHLKYLNQRFNGDWLIALAAYNAGHVRVIRAINQNKKLGRPTDYWSLPLPKETRDFVPKFLAMAYIIENYKSHNIKLLDVKNEPYFTTVTSHIQLDMQRASELAGLSVRDVHGLNPGYRLKITHPDGPHELLLPVAYAQTFIENLNIKSRDPKWRSVSTHTVRHGDNLSVIAKRYKTSISSLKLKNKLKGSLIKPGQKLII